MENQSIKPIRMVITAAIVVCGLYCMATRSELYPFAPYTMYSHVQKISDTDFFQFYCEAKGKDIFITNQMSRPLDEARLGVSVSESYYQQDFQAVITKLNSLKDLVISNDFECEKVRLDVVRFENPETFLLKKGFVVRTLASGEKL